MNTRRRPGRHSHPRSPNTGGPLTGRAVVLTRTPADNRLLAHRLEALGAEVDQIPLNEIQPAPDGGRALQAALTNLGDYQWVVVTSANGVRALVEARGAVAWPDGVHIAVIGEATAEVADAAGLPVNFIPSEATAEQLVAEFPTPIGAGIASARVLAPLAELASSTVCDGLGAKGYQVDQVIAYRTGAPRVDPVVEPALRKLIDTADAVVLAAPSAVSRYVDRFSVTANGRLVKPRAPLVCIGPVTAKRAHTLGLAVGAVANPHNDDGLFDAIQWLLVDDVG